VKTTPAHDSTRLVIVILSRMFLWHGAVVNIKPDTFIRWRRKGFRVLWCWKSRPVGRPRLPRGPRRIRPRERRMIAAVVPPDCAAHTADRGQFSTAPAAAVAAALPVARGLRRGRAFSSFSQLAKSPTVDFTRIVLTLQGVTEVPRRLDVQIKSVLNSL
jgi:hypothetical protein